METDKAVQKSYKMQGRVHLFLYLQIISYKLDICNSYTLSTEKSFLLDANCCSLSKYSTCILWSSKFITGPILDQMTIVTL